MKSILKSFTELTVDELYSILALRSDVFVVEQECIYQDLDGKDQKSSHLYHLNDRSEIVAYARILPPENSFPTASIGRILVHPDYRKHKLGRKIVLDAINSCMKLWPGEAITIGAQSYLLNFYKSIGFEQIGNEYLEDGIPHVDMQLKWKHLDDN